MPAPPSSAWWSRAASTAAPTARRCIRTPLAAPTASTWPATATRIRCWWCRRTTSPPCAKPSPTPRPTAGSSRRCSSSPSWAKLTRAHGSLLLVDSIQAGLRVHGVLSIVDYPGFEGIDPPDMETYSKALNAAQFPLSVLAVTAHAAGLYRKGVYGNTMTTNPRALDVACATLGLLTPQVRQNIRVRGAQAVQKLEALKAELGGLITKVQGTGLLFS